MQAQLSIFYLHSSMERLKVAGIAVIRDRHIIFTFQYGEIKSGKTISLLTI